MIALLQSPIEIQTVAAYDLAIIAIVGILTGIALAFVFGLLYEPMPEDEDEEDERTSLDLASRTGRRP